MTSLLRVAFFAAVLGACSVKPDAPEELPIPESEQAPDGGPGVSADHVEIVKGVPDRGRDPGVVMIRIGDDALCSGALVSPRLVLTARHCVSRTVSLVSCPPDGLQVLGDRKADTLRVYVGEEVSSARAVARGVSIVAPGGVTLCEADIAFLVLDTPVTSVKPLPIRKRGPSVGDRLRAVGFGQPNDDDPAGRKLVREHVRVLSVAAAEFAVGEATCQGDSGGPAIDQDTSEIVGVVSRGGPSCEGPNVHNIYTRVDSYAWLVEEAFARVEAIDLDERTDAGAANPAPKTPKRGSKAKPTSDVGGPCVSAGDCAAGICLTDETLSDASRQYCSRPCGSGDRCPTRYHCQSVAGLEAGERACVNVR